jgi:antirestriction protein ArdC
MLMTLDATEREGLRARRILSKLPSGAGETHGSHYCPCYIPSADGIRLSHLSQFESAEHYYSTLFHELVHSTGHPSRLNRLQKESRGITAYSFEELVAELGAPFLCAVTGIENQRSISEQAAYIQGWKEFLQSDAGCFVKAAAEAPRAVDYLRGEAWSFAWQKKTFLRSGLMAALFIKTSNLPNFFSIKTAYCTTL